MAGVVAQVSQLIGRARDEERPVIYVNDNYGHWNSSSAELLEAALQGRHPEFVEPLRPPQDASFVIKARHSIFYETPFEYLLRQLGVARILLCGQVTEQCISTARSMPTCVTSRSPSPPTPSRTSIASLPMPRCG